MTQHGCCQSSGPDGGFLLLPVKKETLPGTLCFVIVQTVITVLQNKLAQTGATCFARQRIQPPKVG